MDVPAIQLVKASGSSSELRHSHCTVLVSRVAADRAPDASHSRTVGTRCDQLLGIASGRLLRHPYRLTPKDSQFCLGAACLWIPSVVIILPCVVERRRAPSCLVKLLKDRNVRIARLA